MSPRPPVWVGFDGEVVQPENAAARLTAELEHLKRRIEQGYVPELAVAAELYALRKLAADSGLEPWRPNPTMAPLEIRFRPVVAPAPPTQEIVQVPPSAVIREVLGFQQRWLADLPLAFSLLVSTHEGGRLLLTTSRSAVEAARLAQVPAFVGSELGPIALAAEHDRAAPGALAAWCAEKLREPGFRVTPQVALAEIDRSEHRAEQGWTVGRVLRAYGAQLVEVCVGQEVPAW